MTDLEFAVLDLRPEPYAAAPTLLARVRLTQPEGAAVHAVVLRAQIRIDAQRRGYTDAEKAGLLDLFGAPERWGETVRPFVWTHAATTVQGFTGSTEVDLPVPCTYDLEVAGSKYLHALSEGVVPLAFLFAGTVFSRTSVDGRPAFGVTQIAWHRDAAYRMPVLVWRELMAQHFPNTGWLRVDTRTLGRLQRYKSRRALPTWEEAFAALLKEAGVEPE
jgi:hypothetical protein